MIIKKTVGVMLAAALAGFAGVSCYALFLLKKRPPLSLYESRRAQPDFLPLEKIPPKQILLILRQEDRVFYEHPGYNMKLIRRAWKTPSPSSSPKTCICASQRAFGEKRQNF